MSTPSTPSSSTTTPMRTREGEVDTFSPLVHAAIFHIGKGIVTGDWGRAEDALARLLSEVRQRRLEGGEGPG